MALESLFSRDKLLITPAVYSELKVPKEYGYDFPDQIFGSERFELVQLSGGAADEFKSNLLHAKTIQSGELEAITIAKNRGYTFSSMDVRALRYATSQGVEVLHFHTILRALWRFGVLTREEVRAMMDVMEREDNREIEDKHAIIRINAF